MYIDFSKILEFGWREFLFDWQQLVGAFFGALIPILFSLYLFRKDTREKRKKNLQSSEIFLAHTISDLIETKAELAFFIMRLEHTINEIKRSDNKTYIVSATNFPSYKNEFDINIVKIDIPSIYLANKMLICYSLLRDTCSQIEYFREEFNRTVDRNYQIINAYKDPSRGVGISVKDQNQLYLNQLIAIRDVVKNVILDQNLTTTLRSFITARMVFLKYCSNFRTFHRYYLEGIFGKRALKDNGQEVIESKLRDKVDAEMVDCEKEYKDRLDVYIQANPQALF